MAFNANFVEATIDGDRLLTLHGRSSEPSKRPIMVTLQYAGVLDAAEVQHPEESNWTIQFGPSTYEVGETVIATGVAVDDDERADPFVWHDRLVIAAPVTA
ncbi:MAG TPA: hypothetical protein VI318_06370 [Baekduia sp.]